MTNTQFLNAALADIHVWAAWHLRNEVGGQHHTKIRDAFSHLRSTLYDAEHNVNPKLKPIDEILKGIESKGDNPL